MAYPHHLTAFVQLGTFFCQFCDSDTIENDGWFPELDSVLRKAELQNKWYTRDNLLHALAHWGKLLQGNQLMDWQNAYQADLTIPKGKVAIIMAGNIPLVGFHDFLCVLLSGHEVLVKLSSNDSIILPFVKKFLVHIDRSLERKITFTEGKIADFNAVIATGSNNTSRYFEYYFRSNPCIIRKNRNSVAVLTGNESREQLKNLGEDVFRYFGLGCRSVSKLFVPKHYNFDDFFNAIFKWQYLLENHKYANNYDYNKAVYLMSEMQILDNGFLILKEDTSFTSPIATLFFEYYLDYEDLRERLQVDAENIQCIVSNGFIEHEIPFGHAQTPVLTDYADGVDTMQFLMGLN
ncbi:MAG: acyl-CoA reductase [Bacteroidota bacterium]